ncbi:hypothetical protein [Halanaerobacter jeridensis]|uniref:Uncharacterized protein n=1 Tax=Halanaerobacter jeridensis TaxID=706427 RepID=A0A939BR43_9FIRM|nr:hypothetical protein [Halanaerobacter jeridensis]MBM7555606.1 hypothetical protein [Halanaerobacter jeridensis]
MKNLAHRKLFFLILSVIILILFVGCERKEFKSERIEVNKFKKVAVGDKLPGFGIGLKEGGTISSRNYPGNFIIIFNSDQVKEKLEAVTLVDEEHGKLAQPVLDRGGHLISNCDFKLAEGGFGIETINTNKGFRLKDSLIVIADSESRITKLYKNVKLEDLKEIINNIDKFIVEEE